jgi:hypothetical protein
MIYIKWYKIIYSNLLKLKNKTVWNCPFFYSEKVYFSFLLINIVPKVYVLLVLNTKQLFYEF